MPLLNYKGKKFMDETTYIVRIKTLPETNGGDLLNAIDNLFFTIDSDIIEVYND